MDGPARGQANRGLDSLRYRSDGMNQAILERALRCLRVINRSTIEIVWLTRGGHCFNNDVGGDLNVNSIAQ